MWWPRPGRVDGNKAGRGMAEGVFTWDRVVGKLHHAGRLGILLSGLQSSEEPLLCAGRWTQNSASPHSAG